MASLKENYEFWNQSYNWTRYRGDQWSAAWGGPEAQWRWCIYPRIRRHLPVPRILEIGPGHGRWTQFLQNQCENLVVVDISERCIQVCQERFGPERMTYHVGDGRSLEFLGDQSIDFVFSFESLIHTEIEDLGHYLKDLGRVLREDGVGFLHHSNLGQYKRYYDASESLPRSLKRMLRERGLLDFDEWRAPTVTAGKVEEAAKTAGLSMMSQELVPWGGRRFIDCFSTFKSGRVEKPNQVIENRHFLRRAKEIKQLARLYNQGTSWLAGPATN
jgi:SAM-dependent methyltransferase